MPVLGAASNPEVRVSQNSIGDYTGFRVKGGVYR